MVDKSQHPSSREEWRRGGTDSLKPIRTRHGAVSTNRGRVMGVAFEKVARGRTLGYGTKMYYFDGLRTYVLMSEEAGCFFVFLS